MKRSNRPVVRGKRENCPAKTPRCGKSRGETFQILNAGLHNRVLSSITQGQQCDGRIVRMRCKGSSIDDSIPGVPSSARAGTIKQHLDPTLNTEGTDSRPPHEQGSLVQGEDRECGWNNPTDRVRKPWPAKFVGVETNMAIGGTKFPFPEPIPFPADAGQSQ